MTEWRMKEWNNWRSFEGFEQLKKRISKETKYKNTRTEWTANLQMNSNKLKANEADVVVVVGDVDFLFPDIDSLTIQNERSNIVVLILLVLMLW